MLTAHSRIPNKIKHLITIKREDRGKVQLLASKDKSRCPAIILAASRTESVIGRIHLLIISIITIKGINKPGVPKGTRWASIFLGVFIIPRRVWPIQRGRARVMVKLKWLDEVKVNGDRPMELFKRIIKNKDKGIKRNPGADLGRITDENSFSTYRRTWEINKEDEDFLTQRIGETSPNTKSLEAQLNGSLNKEEGSKMENRLVINF